MAFSTAKDHLFAAAPAQSTPSSSLPSSSAAHPAEDESRKKSTDCVYFLASPLTCKKGNECEFRHSEYARVNPRDCWFWLNGNCLNPKCSFRHPPLDTLPGPPVDGSAGSSVPVSSGFPPVSSSPALHPTAPAAYVAAKPAVPCIFFQKGYCLKGDLCPFSHMQNPPSKKASDFHGALSPGFSTFNSAPGELRKCSQLKPTPQANVSKPMEVMTSQPKINVHAAKALPRNGAFAERRGVQTFVANDDFPKHIETASLPYSNGNSSNKPGNASHIIALDEQRIQTRKEVDELQRESSPGFDVLVDDELGGSDYYRNEDQFPSIHGREERELGEYECVRPDRYRPLDDVEPVIYRDRYGYDNYEFNQEKHARDRRYTPSDPHHERTENSDLRHRLSKQRRTDGISSVVVSDRASENLAEERRRQNGRSDTHGSSFSGRLQGRIKLPPSRQSESKYDAGRNRARLSPTRLHLHPQQGRLQDRLKGRIQDGSFGFSRPKSLVELREPNQSQSHSREQHRRDEVFSSFGKRKALESSQQTVDNLSFEAPKPLSEILKRKRKSETSDLPSGPDFGTEINSKPPQPEENAAVVKPEANGEEKAEPNEVGLIATTYEANNEADNEEGLVEDEESKQHQEEGDGYEEEEYDGEAYDEGEGGEAYEEGEGGDMGDEYMDEDDGDNFAKKIGVLFG